MFDVTKRCVKRWLCNTRPLILQKKFKCKHFSYWKYNDYIGLGPGAHGRVKILERSTQQKKKEILTFGLRKQFL